MAGYFVRKGRGSPAFVPGVHLRRQGNWPGGCEAGPIARLTFGEATMSPARFGAFVAAVFVLTAAAVASAGPPVTDVPALIDKLTEVADSDIGYSPVAWGRSFLPLDRKSSWRGGLLFQKPEVPSDTLRAIVKQGAAAVPQLIKHLDDKRSTKIKVTHDFGPLGGMLFTDVCDYNARTAKADPNSKRLGDDDADSRPGPDEQAATSLPLAICASWVSARS